MSDTQQIAAEIENAIAEHRESAAELKRWLLALVRRVEAIEAIEAIREHRYEDSLAVRGSGQAAGD